MSISNLIVGQSYVCDGVITNFQVTFDYDESNQIKVYVIEIATGIVTLLTHITDYTFIPDDFNPTFVVMNTAPPGTYVLRVQRATSLQQVVEYINNSGFNAEDHEKGMDRIVEMIQELALKVTNSVQLSMGDYGKTTVLGKLVANSFLTVNSIGTAIVGTVTLTDIVAAVVASLAGGGGLPTGGLQYALVEKLSVAPADAVWTDPIKYDGISQLLGGQPFVANGIKATLDAIIRITYTPPQINLSGSSNSLREKGASVSGITLTAGITKKSNLIGVVRFYRNPSTLLDTQTSGGGIPNGGNSTYAYATAFTDTVTFRAEVDDVLTAGNQSLAVTSTTTYNFVYPYYYGAGATGKTGAQIRSDLTNDIIVAQTSKLVNFSASVGNRLYFAYPTAYSALTSILDVNSFETLPDWTQTSMNITGLDGSVQSYRVYTFNNLVGVAGTIPYTFKR